MSVKVHPKDLMPELRTRMKKTPEVIMRGMNAGMMQGQAILASRSPSSSGNLRASWKTRRGRVAGGKMTVEPELYNDAPYAGIVEEGARPHPVNKEGIAALTRWARLTFGVDDVEASRIANAVAWKIRRKGQKATYFVRDSTDDLRDALAGNIAREIAMFAKQKAGK